MQRRNRWMLLVSALIAAVFLIAACGQASGGTAKKESPATVEKGDGGINRVTLTEKAAERLAIQTTQVREEQVDGIQRKIIPYAAVIYDLQGKTWTYTSPAHLTFVREAITVDHIDGDRVVLSDGPAPGTEIVTVGVAELYGTDTGIGK
jgi:hypothetical protein